MLICAVCGNMETANQIMELDVDDALAINSMNRSAIVRISQSQTVAVSRAKTQPDNRTAADLLEIFAKIGNSIADHLGISDLFRPLFAQYLEILETRKDLVRQQADADNIFLEISDHKLSHKELRRRLQISGFPGHLTNRLKKSEILSMLEISDHHLPPQPSFLVILALLEISGFKFPADFERVPVFSRVPLEEISDYFVEATHGHYRSIIRLEKFPTRGQLDDVLFHLHSVGIRNFRSIAAMIEKLQGRQQAHQFCQFLQDNKMEIKKNHRTKFRDLVLTLTGSSVLRYSASSVHRKFFTLRDAPGNMFWSLEKVAAICVAAEALTTKKFPIIPNLEISVHEYLKTSEADRHKLLKYCELEIFAHANISVFSDLISVLSYQSSETRSAVPSDETGPTCEAEVPRVFWHPKKTQPGNFPEPWSRLLRYLEMETGVSGRQIHNGALRLEAATKGSKGRVREEEDSE